MNRLRERIDAELENILDVDPERMEPLVGDLRNTVTTFKTEISQVCQQAVL